MDISRIGRMLKRTPRELRTRLVNSNGFQREDLRQFLTALMSGGITFMPVDKFARRYKRFTRRKRQRPPKKSFGVLKFDLHNDIERPLEVAKMLNEIGAPGLFLMMPRHPLNESFYDKERTWEILREIQSLGHEVGLHADVFDLISTYRDLYKGLKVSVDDMRARGLNIRTASVHGDTRRHIKAVGMQGNDFFKEGFRSTKWNGNPPAGQEFYAEHVHRYSHRKIAKECGLRFFAEVRFLKNGRLISKDRTLYLSDNHRALEIRNIPGRPRKEILTCEKEFGVTPEFTTAAIEALKKRPFLTLLHPQWYR